MSLYAENQWDNVEEAATHFRVAADLLLMSVECDRATRESDARDLLGAFVDEFKKGEAILPVVSNAR